MDGHESSRYYPAGPIAVIVDIGDETLAQRRIADDLGARELGELRAHEEVAPGRLEGNALSELDLETPAGIARLALEK